MVILDSILALIQLGIQYLKLKNQTVLYDLSNAIDSRLDSLSAKRETLRKIATSESQQAADDVMDQIIEIQKRKKLFLDDWKTEHPIK